MIAANSARAAIPLNKRIHFFSHSATLMPQRGRRRYSARRASCTPPLPGREGPGVGPPKAAETPSQKGSLAALAYPPSAPPSREGSLRVQGFGLEPPDLGQVAEWFKAAVLKTAVGASPPWV